MYKVYISSYDGLTYTGLCTQIESVAKAWCATLNQQNENRNCQYIYCRC